MAVKLIEFKVHGVMFNQSVMNVLHATVGENTDQSPDGMVNLFRKGWRDWILPLLSVDYSVFKYELKTIAGVVFKETDPEAPLVNLLRYTDVVSRTGQLIDKGDIATDALPSYACVGIGKVCPFYLKPDLTTKYELTKIPKGSIRFAGIPEDRTEAHTNRLTAAYLQLWVDNFENFRALVGAGNDQPTLMTRLAVVTTVLNKLAITNPGPPVTPSYAVAPVYSYTVNPFITSQVSRKQSLNNLG